MNTFTEYFDKKYPMIVRDYCGYINRESIGNKGLFPIVESYPPQVLEYAVKQLSGDDTEHLILVSDSKNDIRKAALFLATDKKEKKIGNTVDEYEAAIYGERIFTEGMGFVEIDCCNLEREAENFLKTYVNELTKNIALLYVGLDSTNMTESIRRLILSQNVSDTYVGISEDSLLEPFVQSLICEGNYRILRLPSKGRNYYEKLYNEILLMPAYQMFCEKHEHEGFTFDDIINETYLKYIDIEDVRNALSALSKRRGQEFTERDIAVFLDLVEENFWDLSAVTRLVDDKKGKLEDMIGLKQLKDTMKGIAAMSKAAKRNPKLNYRAPHMLFVGNPGTGKSVCGEYMYNELTESGCVSGKLIMASREKIIGRFVGHTAHNVQRLFNEAKNGIIYVDEAGYLLQDKIGSEISYVKEAVKEFVRYMEERKDVIVIFALYPHEKEEFYELEAGMRSRIDKVINFPDYSNEELYVIAKKMWNENGYDPDKTCYHTIMEYFDNQREISGKSFGNARDARKLMELSIEKAELRINDEPGSMKEDDESRLITVTATDITDAVTELTCKKKKADMFGFRT